MDAGAISTLKLTQAVLDREAADAALKQAQTGAEEAEAGVQQADAGVSQAQAAVLRADAGLAEAQAAKLQADAGDQQSQSPLKVAQSNVPSVQAQLEGALFDLAQCKMYAPEDGYIVDWQVQEGSWVAPMRVVAIGTFIVTPQMFIVAVFPQSRLMN